MPRYDRDDDAPDELDISRPRPNELSWMDQQFLNTPLVALIFFAICCGDIALIFGILGIALCKDSTARRNAIIVLAISAVRVGLAVIAILGNNMAPRR
jgi:hypothetical protein